MTIVLHYVSEHVVAAVWTLASIAVLGASLRPSSLKPHRGSTAASAALTDQSDAVAMAIKTVTRCTIDRSAAPQEMQEALDTWCRSDL